MPVVTDTDLMHVLDANEPGWYIDNASAVDLRYTLMSMRMGTSLPEAMARLRSKTLLYMQNIRQSVERAETEAEHAARGGQDG